MYSVPSPSNTPSPPNPSLSVPSFQRLAYRSSLVRHLAVHGLTWRADPRIVIISTKKVDKSGLEPETPRSSAPMLSGCDNQLHHMPHGWLGKLCDV